MLIYMENLKNMIRNVDTDSSELMNVLNKAVHNFNNKIEGIKDIFTNHMNGYGVDNINLYNQLTDVVKNMNLESRAILKLSKEFDELLQASLMSEFGFNLEEARIINQIYNSVVVQTLNNSEYDYRKYDQVSLVFFNLCIVLFITHGHLERRGNF